MEAQPPVPFHKPAPRMDYHPLSGDVIVAEALAGGDSHE